ncbi:Uncharacterized protein PBTT_08018 [Plasmodiophora brassicae]|nr:hypothetical protein PBRA_004356 [Plasmodiophora brassicae]
MAERLRRITVIDTDMPRDMLDSVMSVVGETARQWHPLAPPPDAFVSDLPLSGWYVTQTRDPKITMFASKYDPGTYIRFQVSQSAPTIFIMYRIDTGRPSWQIPLVTVDSDDPDSLTAHRDGA